MYITQKGLGKGEYDIAEHMRINLEPLLVKYGVDLGLWGHIHSYQRTCSMIDYKCDNEKGVMHVVVGTAGADLDHDGFENAPWSVKNIDQWGYAKIEANATRLHWQFVFNEDRSVFDEFYLYKD